jgi:hypothetical protein
MHGTVGTYKQWSDAQQRSVGRSLLTFCQIVFATHTPIVAAALALLGRALCCLLQIRQHSPALLLLW